MLANIIIVTMFMFLEQTVSQPGQSLTEVPRSKEVLEHGFQ